MTPFPRSRASLGLAGVLLATASAAQGEPTIRLVAVSGPDPAVLGLQPDAESSLFIYNALSGDGRYLVFGSLAGNLVAGDTNAGGDVFWRDLVTGTTRRISVTAAGAQVAAVEVSHQSLSEDGRWVVFATKAAGLVPGDTDAFYDVFRHDTQSGAVVQVSVGAGVGSDSDCGQPTTSLDGNRVAFFCAGSNMVPGDSNDTLDIFVRDIAGGITLRASVADGSGAQASGYSISPRLSRDGNRVAFLSAAGNLVAGDTNNKMDVFVRDLGAGSTVRVSVDSAGQQIGQGSDSYDASPSLSFVAFTSFDPAVVAGDSNGVRDVFLRSTPAATTVRVSVAHDGSQANAQSFSPTISSNSTRLTVGFASYASNLVPGDDNEAADVFVRRIDTGTTERVSFTIAGGVPRREGGSPAISSNARYVAYVSHAPDALAGDLQPREDIVVRDLQLGSNQPGVLADPGGPFPAQSTGDSYRPVPSDGGARVAFLSDSTNLGPGDSNTQPDAYVRYLLDGSVRRASVGDAGQQGDESTDALALSADGQRVVFQSLAGKLAGADAGIDSDLFLRDAVAGTTQRLSRFGALEADADVEEPSTSADARYTAYVSYASNFPAGAGVKRMVSQAYLHDAAGGTTAMVSLASDGTSANRDCRRVAVSDDGRYVAMECEANNLAPGDDSLQPKILRRDLQSGQTVLVSVPASGTSTDAYSELHPRGMSSDGRYIAFTSAASNMVSGDTNDAHDVFLRDVVAGTTTRISLRPGGVEASGYSWDASISADGRFVAFHSNDPGLTGDTEARAHVMLFDRATGTARRVSTDAAGTIGDADSDGATLARDGRNVAFSSRANNWTIASGVRSPLRADAFLVRLIEATATVVSAVAPSPSSPGQAVLVTARVSGSDSEPRAGALLIQASTGESCTTPSVARISDLAAGGSCSLTFASGGERALTARWTATRNYLGSVSAPVAHATGAPGTLFSHGFEGP
jgi:Tol biopolymer transport system component